MKKVMRIVLALLVVIMASSLPAYAARGGHGGGHFGHGGRGHFGHGGGRVGVGVFVGPGLWGPGWWDPYPYYDPYYPSAPIIVQPPIDLYVQPSPQQEAPHYWYFCPDPQGYYPYVKTCPKGWMKVVPPAYAPEGGE